MTLLVENRSRQTEFSAYLKQKSDPLRSLHLYVEYYYFLGFLTGLAQPAR